MGKWGSYLQIPWALYMVLDVVDGSRFPLLLTVPETEVLWKIDLVVLSVEWLVNVMLLFTYYFFLVVRCLSWVGSGSHRNFHNLLENGLDFGFLNCLFSVSFFVLPVPFVRSISFILYISLPCISYNKKPFWRFSTDKTGLRVGAFYPPSSTPLCLFGDLVLSGPVDRSAEDLNERGK